MRSFTATMAIAMTLIAGLGSTQALAGTPGTIGATWDAYGIGVGFHASVKNKCISPTVGAANSWNAVNAGFNINVDTASYHPRVAEQTQAFNYAHITVEDSLPVPGSVDALMWVQKTISGTDTIVNADVYTLRSIGDIDQWLCYPSDGPVILDPDDVKWRYDWRSAMTHELGHAVGFGHTTATDDMKVCVMYPYLAQGEFRAVLCASEKQEFIRAYGNHYSISVPDISIPVGTTGQIAIHYTKFPKFPLRGKLDVVSCGGGTCNGGQRDFTQQASPLKHPFTCNGTITFTTRYKYTMTAADGVSPPPVEFNITCLKS